jgi:hypothetical protein
MRVSTSSTASEVTSVGTAGDAGTGRGRGREILSHGDRGEDRRGGKTQKRGVTHVHHIPNAVGRH